MRQRILNGEPRIDGRDTRTVRPITVKVGEPLTLVVTRKTEQTCATDIVVKDYGINAKLPLNTPTVVSFTPTRTGELRYGCAMGQMISGVLTVQ